MATEKKTATHSQMTEGKRSLVRQLIQEYAPKTALDIQDALKDLLGSTLKEMLEAEMDNHLGYSKSERSDNSNSRNGYKTKQVRSSMGEFSIEVPQDRESTFQPQVVQKRQKDISEIESKIIAMYGKGFTTNQISETVQDIYGFDVSDGFISDVTDRILPRIEEWQNRPLCACYPIVYIDAIHFSVRDNGMVKKMAGYVVLCVNSEGMTEILTIEVGENENSRYWLGVLNGLKNRGVQDILILCSDGLSGIKEAIAAAFPKTEQQRCIVHMIRNTLKFVNYKDRKQFATDLKSIYLAPNEQTALKALEAVNAKWTPHYKTSMKRWYDNWDAITPIFKFSLEVRRVIYTTNAIESLNSSYRRINRQRSVFPSPVALMKALYLATTQVTRKWTMPVKNWGGIISELSIMYPDRIPE